jgi:hypothetical protein
MTPDRPAAEANAARNAHRRPGRRARWAPVRDALWAVLEERIPPGARVAVVGAGNGDDLPLARIAAAAGSVTLLDVDPRTAGRARGRVRIGLRRRIRVVEHDATLGAADRAVREATRPAAPDAPVPDGPATPLPGGAYDVVVGDLLYSQLLYPALLDAGVPAARRRETIRRHGAALTRGVVGRLHASAPVVVHVHDPACWGNGYAQPEALADVLAAAQERGTGAALELLARTKGPREADPRPALAALGVPTIETRVWRWPFVEGVDYAVVATVAGTPGPPSPEPREPRDPTPA